MRESESLREAKKNTENMYKALCAEIMVPRKKPKKRKNY